ncbi:sulfotransferase [Phaeocystidibacter marisrubri]|uniref:Sulfotransferase n=1 Tax=Phaeocystidibacter marisrubri TaxID=1577780 RepID=A0A6L3ZGV7_9FLAO|nr:sulfotransferase [Phaeocystidibacter marisrubri]
MTTESSILKLPEFIIGGAPKCGTSSLYFWLAAHPEVYGSPVKETFFYSDAKNNFGPGPHCSKDDVSVYAKYFQAASAHQKAFEATAHYLYCDNARTELMNLPTQPKMIFLLREPSMQMFSHYRMIRYRLNGKQTTFEDYCKKEDWHRLADYSLHLSKWLEQWGHERVRVYLFEDLMRNKEAVLSDISNFLDIDSDFYSNFDFEHRNKTVKIKSGGLHQFGLKVQRYIPHGVQKLLLPLYMKFNSDVLPEMTDAERALLATLKSEKRADREELQQLIPYLPLQLWD